MSAAPERISIKRRRTDGPVDHLFYQSKKQRTANHVFVRLQPDDTGKPASLQTSSQSSHGEVKSLVSGIPAVGATKPGDVVRDFQQYKALVDAHRETKTEITGKEHGIANSALIDAGGSRRFHLTRDLSTTLRPQILTGLRHKTNLRPHLPTFVERLRDHSDEGSTNHAKVPAEKIINSDDPSIHEAGLTRLPRAAAENNDVQKFRQAETGILKTGNSIKDPLETWNLDSDQLADELVALALDLDPEAKTAYQQEQQLQRRQNESEEHSSMLLENQDEYIFETYVRLKPDAAPQFELSSNSKSFGYLIIDDEEEDLWEQYLKDEQEDDDEWDEYEEDSNAEDNPRNDYPDEELSSDDEFGQNVYKYRHYGSDDELFDNEMW